VSSVLTVIDLLQMTGGGVQTEQLPGIIACQTDDVIRHNWHGLFLSHFLLLFFMHHVELFCTTELVSHFVTF